MTKRIVHQDDIDFIETKAKVIESAIFLLNNNRLSFDAFIHMAQIDTAFILKKIDNIKQGAPTVEE